MIFSNTLASSLQSDFTAWCRQLIRRFLPDVEVARIVPLQNSGGFSGATIYRVESADGTFALRQWPVEMPAPARIQELHQLLKFLAEQGLEEVAVPRRTVDGRSMIFEAGHWWQLEPWMPGRADFHQIPGRQRLRNAMRSLARWHLAAAEFTPQTASTGFFHSYRSATSPGLSERLQRLRQLSSGVRQQLWHTHVTNGRAQADASAMESRWGLLMNQVHHALPIAIRAVETVIHSPVPLQPVLRDIWHDHVLFTGDEVTGIIDPSACRTDSVATDLARLLGSLLEDDQPLWSEALAAYQAVRPLTLRELQMVAAFDISGVVLSGVTWLEWIQGGRTFGDGAQVQSRLDAINRRLSTRLARL